jgi:hypothetical protein
VDGLDINDLADGGHRACARPAISLSVSSLGAYALVRLKWFGAGFISTAILLTYLMPGIMLVVPLFQIFSLFKLTNTLGSLVLAYPIGLMPFACWLLMGYYRSIPEELEESALIDGCNKFTAFRYVVFPLVLPALVVVALFSITGAWNEFLMAFVFIPEQRGHHPPGGPRQAHHRGCVPLGANHGRVDHHVGPGGHVLRLRAALPGGRADGRQRKGVRQWLPRRFVPRCSITATAAPSRG